MSDPILTINGGSSTIKFAAFSLSDAPQRILTGQVDGIGRADTTLAATDMSRTETHRFAIHATDHRQAAQSLIDWIAEWAGARQFQAIGHRIVHGGVRLDRHAGAAAGGRVILAHLGSGASLTALNRGMPVDTSMAFTPTSALMMGTPPGDLDPGLLVYVGIQIGFDAMGNVLKEFWPDLQRKFSKRSRKYAKTMERSAQ